MSWFGSILVYSVKRTLYQNLLSKLCLEALIPNSFQVLMHARRALNTRIDRLGSHLVMQVSEDVTTLLRWANISKLDEKIK